MVHQVWPPATVGCLNNGGILRVRTQLSYILAVCVLILVKIFLITEENDVGCIGWFTSGAQSFLHSCTSCIHCPHGFQYKDSLFTLCYTRDALHSFPMSAAKHFYDNPLSIYLDPKIVLIYRPHPVEYFSHPFIHFSHPSFHSATHLSNPHTIWKGFHK